jgi:hypothetical protein
MDARYVALGFFLVLVLHANPTLAGLFSHSCLVIESFQEI